MATDEPRTPQLSTGGDLKPAAGLLTMDEYQAILQRANRRYMGEIALDAADDVLVLLDVIGKMNLQLHAVGLAHGGPHRTTCKVCDALVEVRA